MNLPMDCGMNESHSRFRDLNAPLFTGPAIVVCPRCSGAARAYRSSVACGVCGFSRVAGEPTFVGEANVLVHMAWRPRCSHCGKELPKTARRAAQSVPKQLTVRCNGCRHVGSYPVRISPQRRRVELDPASGLPYYLSVPVGSNILWVRNLNHLELIETYISAKLRERTLAPVRMTMLARLPLWIKAASSRREILLGVKHLRARAAKARIM